MDASDHWHDSPRAGLISRRRGVPTHPFGAVYTDRGLSWFSDVGFPAHREEIYRSAVAHGAPRVVLAAILRLPHVVATAWDVTDLDPLPGGGDPRGSTPLILPEPAAPPSRP